MNPQRDRSIRKIPVPAGHRRVQEEDLYDDEVQVEVRPKRSRRLPHIHSRLLWVVGAVVLVCAFAGILLSTVFSGAVVSVSARTAVVTAPSVMTIQPNAAAGSLSYQVVTTTRIASTTVDASGTQRVSRAATGVMTIYNAYSTETQRLIVNTRFEAPDGKIYRIRDSVVVPGATKSADGDLQPGTATVSAYADSPGESYNKGAAQFTIPGFKGDPRYEKFYGKADDMSGGLVGEEPAVAPADVQKAKTLLKDGLEGALREATAKIPKEYLPIPGTLTISYGSVTQTPAGNDKVTFSQNASASANIVRITDLAAAVAKETVTDYKGEAVGFADPTQISIALATASSSATGPLQLRLSGTPTLVWQFDPNALKQALVGKDKSSFEEIVRSFAPAILCTKNTPCKASVRPFWSSSFPSDSEKISIVTGQ